MQHPDEGMIHTWLDGQLPADEAAALEAHVAECEQCKASVAEARGFIAASSRIVGALDNVPAGVIPIAKPVKRAWYSSPQFRAAAAVLIVAGASFLVMRPGTQKKTPAVSSNTEASEAAATQQVMSAPSPAVAAAPAAVQPTAVADQALSRKEASKTATATMSPPKAFSALNAPVRESDAARVTLTTPKAANEADFRGKEVMGGFSAGVDTSVLSGKVAGAAMKAADAVSPMSLAATGAPELKVIHVDSTATTRKTTYASSSGKEMVLTEEEPSPALARATATTEVRQRAAAAPSPAPTVMNAPVPSAAMARRAAVVNTINWIDPLTLRRYSLSGPVTVGELEVIKAQLLLQKH